MGRRIVLYVLPILGGQLVSLAAGTVALAVLGGYGIDALGAAAAPIALYGLALALFSGVASGSMILAARSHVAGEEASVKRIVARALVLSVGGGIAAALLGTASAPSMLHAANVQAAIFPLALRYAQLLALSLPAAYAITTLCALLYALDDAKNAFFAQLTYAVLYVVALFALRIGPLAVPIALLAASLLTAGGWGLALYVSRPQFRLEVPVRAMLPTAKGVAELLHLDAPVNLQFAAIALADVVLTGIANSFGARGGAAFVVVMQIAAWLVAPATAFATAAASNERGLRASIAANLALGGAMTLAVYLFARPLLHTFIADPQVLHTAVSGILTIGWSALALGTANVLCADLDAHGQTQWSAFIAAGGVWFVLIPGALLFAGPWGLDGVWGAYALAYAAIAVTQIACVPLLRARRSREQVTAASDRTV